MVVLNVEVNEDNCVYLMKKLQERLGRVEISLSNMSVYDNNYDDISKLRDNLSDAIKKLKEYKKTHKCKRCLYYL